MFWEGVYQTEKGRFLPLWKRCWGPAIFCGCAVLRCCMPHFIAGRAQMCAANGLLKGVHEAGNRIHTVVLYSWIV